MKRIGVVIPARNEEALLPWCLDALEVAVAAVDVPVCVVVVLDDCTDESRSVARARPWVTCLDISARNVGVARSRGTATVLSWVGADRLSELWIATTDADSQVPPDWLVRQLQLGKEGWDVVVGTVAVTDWSEHDATAAQVWIGGYQATEHHPHVHGANLGFRATAYLRSGGWLPLAVEEDVAIVTAMADCRLIRTAEIPVVTSARRQPRAAGGFGDTLRALAGER